jgi:toxin FitB
LTFLVDTNLISEIRRRATADKAVLAWFAAQREDTLFLSVASIQELYYGALLKQRKDQSVGQQLLRWIDDFVIAGFQGRILPIDTHIARKTAELNVPVTRPYRDALIAATALEHDMIVATRNVKDFAPMGVRVINPWDYTL